MKKIKTNNEILAAKILAAKILDNEMNSENTNVSAEASLIESDVRSAMINQERDILESYNEKLKDLIDNKHEQVARLESRLINLVDKEKQENETLKNSGGSRIKQSFRLFKKQPQKTNSNSSLNKHSARLDRVLEIKNKMKNGAPLLEILAHQKLNFFEPDLIRERENELRAISEQKARELQLKKTLEKEKENKIRVGLGLTL